MTTLCYAQTKFFVRVEKSVSRLLLWIKGILLIIIKYFFSFFKFFLNFCRYTCIDRKIILNYRYRRK